MAQPTWIGYKLNDRYLIEEELGAGGMSAVYKASDPNLKRVVAIKLIHPHLSSNPDFVRRFETEASSVAQLRHPNIVQVYDFNNDGDTYYMVLEFVPGESLQQRLKRLNDQGRRLSIDEVIDLTAKTCDAVDYAHKRGLVHRDIKPANVMINVQGEPILMDFGIVKILGGDSHTATGAVVGTALYMSPEQIRGEHPDHRADIYSLGVMLYEMVSGKPPYEADSAMTIMMMHLNDPIPDIQASGDAIPAGFPAILARALAKDPAQRYQSAGEMAAALRALKAGSATAAQDAQMADSTQVESPPAPEPDATFVEPAGTAAATPPPPPPATSDATYVEPAQPTPPPPQTPRPAAQPAPQQPQPQATASRSPNKRFLWIGGIIGAIVLLGCIISGVVFLPDLIGGFTGDNQAVATEADGGLAIAPDATATAEPTQVPPTATLPPPTDTPAPTDTPTITPTPTATQPEGPFVLITDITVENGAYYVYYEVFNFDPVVSTTAGTNHIHFFWNIYEPETVGVNGIGDSTGGGFWILYDKPSPFVQLTPGSRPQGATQICALVANHDHSINLDSGNCYDLPE